MCICIISYGFFFFQAEDGIRDVAVTGVQTCALPIWLVNSLNHETILKDLHSGMKYDEVGAKHNCSKGTVWRNASHYDQLKYKKSGLKDLSKSETGRRHGWACGRPMAKYRGAYPGGFLKRLDKLLGIQEGHKVLHLFSGSIKDRENEDTMDIQKENNPTFVADARGEFPMKDNQYDVLIVDPPTTCKQIMALKSITATNFGKQSSYAHTLG